MAPAAHTITWNGQAPPCEHLGAVRQVPPRSNGCQWCLVAGHDWVELWVCMSCGWVACSDNSPNQHAKAHYQETDHPLVAALRPGSTWKWCYVHQRVV
jgi:uncharacterized UBP type Zn finger protein